MRLESESLTPVDNIDSKGRTKTQRALLRNSGAISVVTGCDQGANFRWHEIVKSYPQTSGAQLGISKNRGGMVVSRHLRGDFDHFD